MPMSICFHFCRIYFFILSCPLKSMCLQLSCCLSICLSICLSVCLFICPSVCLFVFHSVCLSVCPSVYPSVCLYSSTVVRQYLMSLVALNNMIVSSSVCVFLWVTVHTNNMWVSVCVAHTIVTIIAHITFIFIYYILLLFFSSWK